MKIKMTEKHKLMAWVLYREFRYTMTAIAQLMRVSQSSISSAVKEVDYWQNIRNLSKELSEARQIIIQNGLLPPNDPILYP